MRVAFFIALIHFALFFMLTLKESPQKKPIAKSIKVHEVVLEKKNPTSIAVSPIKQTQKIVQAPKKESPQKKILQNKKIRNEKYQEAAKLLQGLALDKKITKSEKKSSHKKIVLKSDEIFDEKLSFEQLLILYLKEQLEIPQKDRIVLDLTLGCDGKFISAEIKKCNEVANREYLNKTLGNMHFPPFDSTLKQTVQKRFSLTFEVD